MKEYLHVGCQRGSLNLWTIGFKHEKIQICGDRQNVRIGGIGRMLMIELYITDPKLDVNFRMQYQLVEPFRLFLIVFDLVKDTFVLSRNVYYTSSCTKTNYHSVGKTCSKSKFVIF